MTQPGIRKSLETMQALCVSVIFAEHSFCENPRNTECSNATEIDCTGSVLLCTTHCIVQQEFKTLLCY